MGQQHVANGETKAARRVGVRAFARRKGVNPSTVVKAIRSGRLERSITYDAKGHPRIDVALGDAEWAANRDPAYVRETDGRESRRQKIKLCPAPDVPAREPGAAARALEASRVLVSLLAEHERHLARAFRQAAKARPDAPAGAWEPLYATWKRIPDVLELLQAELRDAAEEERE